MIQINLFGYLILLLSVIISNVNPSAEEIAEVKSEEFNEEEGRIVGGQPTTIQQYPYQLSLQYLFNHICGASIIAKNYAVTAAHCTDGNSATTLTLRSDSSTINSLNGNIHIVTTIYQHPQYTNAIVDNDIALLEVANNFFGNLLTIGSIAAPIPLCSVEIPTGANTTITGWGTTAENGTLSNMLQVAYVPKISNADCQSEYGTDVITPSMMCAGKPEGGVDACQGDSGGPLAYQGKLCGITSWGYGCARPGFAGVYTNVIKYIDYIVNITGPL